MPCIKELPAAHALLSSTRFVERGSMYFGSAAQNEQKFTLSHSDSFSDPFVKTMWNCLERALYD